MTVTVEELEELAAEGARVLDLDPPGLPFMRAAYREYEALDGDAKGVTPLAITFRASVLEKEAGG